MLGSKFVARWSSPSAVPNLTGHLPVLRASKRGTIALQVRASAVAIQQTTPEVRAPPDPSADPRTLPQVPSISNAAKPGYLDDQKFIQDWSVQLWRDFRVPADIRNEDLPTATRGRAIVKALREGSQKARVFDSPQSLAYWTYHLSRMGFFATQGIAGLIYSNYVASQAPDDVTTVGAETSGMDLGRIARSGIYFPISEAMLMWYQDYENIRMGLYKLPWDMTTSGHKQTNPLNIIDKFSRFIREASSTLKRRSVGKPDKVWLESGLYPNYYLNSWHYQTDGWLSEESAKVYESSTETLFVGRQDAMQRQSLVPLKRFMDQKGSPDGHGLQLLEVAGGTGRFATFIKDNYPAMGITQVELSPFYLQEARRNMNYWRKKRGAGYTAEEEDRFLHAPAEKVPVADNSYDVVTSTYLFHELPNEARKKAIAEMARIVKPGGLVILNDGSQLGDRPSLDSSAGNFEAFNEPNWGTHIALDYGKWFQDVGLKPGMKLLASGSKVLSFTKPL